MTTGSCPTVQWIDWLRACIILPEHCVDFSVVVQHSYPNLLLAVPSYCNVDLRYNHQIQNTSNRNYYSINFCIAAWLNAIKLYNIILALISYPFQLLLLTTLDGIQTCGEYDVSLNQRWCLLHFLMKFWITNYSGSIADVFACLT